MSFSSEVKTELSQLNNLKNKQEVYMELLGYLSSKNTSMDNKKIKFATENQYNINRFSKLLNNVNISNFKIEFRRNTYTITIEKKEYDLLNSTIEQFDYNKKENLNKAYVRGCFLGGGTLNEPSNNYHLEINFNNEDNLKKVVKLLKEFGIIVKLIKNSKTLYIKEGEEISKFLAFVGASKNVLKFEEIRVMREMKNNVNRLVNCETANLNKTIDASVEQISYIKKIKKANKFDKLPEDIKELANLREKNPNATLSELGKMLKKPIGKSSISTKFKKIKLIAENMEN